MVFTGVISTGFTLEHAEKVSSASIKPTLDKTWLFLRQFPKIVLAEYLI